MDSKISRLRAYGVDIYENIEGRKLTSFQSGGAVRLLLKPSDLEGLLEILHSLYMMGEKYIIIGNGTNILISDKGYDGVIISLKRIKNLRVEDNYIYSSSGINVSTISLIARDNCLTGMEFSIGIPATFGGAIAMNAGAYGSQMSNKIVYVDILNGKCIERWHNSEMCFGYRNSIILNGDLIVLGALLNLDYGNDDEIRTAIREYTKRRKSAQPTEPSAGSVFKRVLDKSPAYFIEQLGHKGLRVGGAEISKKHANFIVNTGNATTNDFLELAKRVADDVYENYGLELEREIKLIGD